MGASHRLRFANALGIAALLLLSVPAARSAPIVFANVLPDGGSLQKPVRSLRELQFTDVVEQKTDYSCGAAALATILRYAYRRPVSEEDVLRGLLEVGDPRIVKRLGFSLLDIKRYVERLGMRGRGYRVAVEALPTIQIPVIALLDIKGYKHFVVVRKATADAVYIADSALGNRTLTREEFAAGWNGVVFAVLGAGYDRNTPLLRAVARPTVQRNALQAPLSDAELYEFGFTHTELF